MEEILTCRKAIHRYIFAVSTHVDWGLVHNVSQTWNRAELSKTTLLCLNRYSRALKSAPQQEQVSWKSNSLRRNKTWFCVGVYSRRRLPSIIGTYTKPRPDPPTGIFFLANLGLVLTWFTTWKQRRPFWKFSWGWHLSTFKNIGWFKGIFLLQELKSDKSVKTCFWKDLWIK